jgi:hypothetical protein
MRVESISVHSRAYSSVCKLKMARQMELVEYFALVYLVVETLRRQTFDGGMEISLLCNEVDFVTNISIYFN